jgi:UDP-N-acetylmuramate dehydrogenase
MDTSLSHQHDLIVQENIPLAPFTTLEVGGPARYFVRADAESDVIDAFGYARANGLDVFVLGGGSNILVSDEGFDGLVIQIALKGVSISGLSVNAAAGENWDTLVERCVGENLAGFECLSGIPGTVGGTPVQNVGAYGQEVSETVTTVRCFDRSTNRIVDLTNANCGFAYRTSIFNSSERSRYVVLSVDYLLEKNGAPKIAYKDLTDHFAGRQPTLAETRDAVLAIRRSKSMVIDESDENRRSAGSFFKNPVVTRAKYDEIAAENEGSVPGYPTADGKVKIPAAWLIENAGFHKGYAKGCVGISTRHTLAIVNRGGAAAADVMSLKDDIQAAVSIKFGIDLIPETVFVGDFDAKN